MKHVVVLVVGIFLIKLVRWLFRQNEKRNTILAESLITGYGLLLFLISDFSGVELILGLTLLIGGFFWTIIHMASFLVSRAISDIKAIFACLKHLWNYEVIIRVTFDK